MPLEVMAAGPWLAGALGEMYPVLGELDDQELAGFLGACQKVAAWVGGMLLGGIAEFATRRPDDSTPGRAALHAAAVKAAGVAAAAGETADPPPFDEFAADELAAVMRLSKGGALRQIELGLRLRYRLPATRAALLAGRLDTVRARIIAEATEGLSAEDAAAVEEMVLPRAGRQTYTALGIALGKAVIAVDPEGAIRRRKKAEKRARVERWRESDGTGALAGRNLPPDDTLAADQALTGQALALREAGLDGPLDFLRAIALIDRITGRDSRPSAPDPGEDSGDRRDRGPQDLQDAADDRDTEGDPGGEDDEDDTDQDDWEDRRYWPDLDREHLDLREPTPGPQDQDDAGHDDGHGGPGGDRPGGGRRGRRPGKGRLRVKARMTVTVPARTMLGLGNAPGEAAAFGPLDGAAARDLARRAAADPGTRWCVTVVDDNGHAIGHGCARGPQPWIAQLPRAGPGGLSGSRDDGRPRGPGDPGGPRGPGDDGGPGGAGSGDGPNDGAAIRDLVARMGVVIRPIARGDCDHREQEDRYRPSRKLRHLVHARTPRCSYWGCRRPAEVCDDDHTLAWERGGRTCQCNISPLCRRHHRMKQREGWILEQPSPGVMRWRTPGGLVFSTGPAQYTV